MKLGYRAGGILEISVFVPKKWREVNRNVSIVTKGGWRGENHPYTHVKETVVR